MRIVLAAAAAVTLFAATTASLKAGDGDWTPTVAQVRHMESKVQLPDGASAMSAYVRFYAGITDNGRRQIEAVYLAPDAVTDMQRNTSPAVQIVAASKIPNMMDGGCRVVTVFFDVASDAVIDMHCNAQA